MARQVKALKLNDSVALESDLGSKLNQSAAAPEFSAEQDYPAGYHVTREGNLYRFTSAHAAGAWTGNDVVLEDMTTPDAMLDVTSAGKLRVVAADGTIVWAESAAPVDSVNGKTGTVVLDASDVGAAVYQQIGIPEFESTATYAVGKLVVYSNAVWKCKTAIATAGAWDASKWNKILELSETNSIFPNAITIGSRGSGTVGVRSIAIGDGNVASGINSFAAGDECSASAYGSRAEGEATAASGQAAHAEGVDTIASGDYSHAEGGATTASGDGSHAEGSDTTASGSCSHAEGNSTTASQQYAHAEGSTTSANAFASHAEGSQCVAQGGFSHAEGSMSEAHGNASHAEGYKAVTAQSGNGQSASSPHACAFAWQGYTTNTARGYYHSHGDGTFNINPIPAAGQSDVATGFYIGELTLSERLRYAITTKTPTVSSGTASISLDDRTCNVSETTASVVELTFPVGTTGHARDFLLLLDTTESASAPTLAYASFMTVVADEDMDLTPEVGLNLYTFTEVGVNTFAATRTTLVTIAEKVPQSSEDLLTAAQQAGYPTTGVTNAGQLATALGLPENSTFADCVNKVMLG